MKEALREPILKALDQHQAEIKRNRTRLDVATDVWLTATDALGRGAKNLEPAIELIGETRKELVKAQTLELEAEEHPKLPLPDQTVDEN